MKKSACVHIQKKELEDKIHRYSQEALDRQAELRSFIDLYNRTNPKGRDKRLMANAFNKVNTFAQEAEELSNYGNRVLDKFYEPSQMTLFGKLSGYTATCLKFGKNKLGNRQCKKYAPTCGSADEGCRIEPALIPGRARVRTRQDTEIEAKAIAQMLAEDANQDLVRNKELLRQVIAYGGIAPHKGGFMKEEYSELPDKYKRKEGIPLDELAQEMGTDERTLSDNIYSAEAQFRQLKEMRKGSTTKKFKSDDFIDEAWNRMESGRGFMGLSGISLKRKVCRADATEKKIHCRVQNPKEFGAFFMRKSTTPGVSYVMGQVDSNQAIVQSVLFDKHIWDTRKAKIWFNRNIDRLLKRDRKSLILHDLGKGKIHDEDYFSPRQQDMFPSLRRELVLEPDNNESMLTVDPLDDCLKRRGWDIPKVRKYQQNISAKMTPDMFGKIEKLTGAEVMLQEQIQKCLEHR